MRGLAVFCVFTFVVAGCGGSSPVGADVDAEGSWRLESGTVRGEPVPLVLGYRITLRIEGDRASGTAACNRYGATLRIEGNSLSLNKTSATQRGCRPEVMSSEEAYLSALVLVDTVARDGAELVISAADTTLRFAPLPPVPEAALLDTRWILNDLLEDGIPVAVDGEAATLELRADRTLSGSTGCRSLRGTYVVEGDEILATELAAEGRCPAALTDQDAHVVTVLGDGFRVAIRGDRLLLTSMGSLGLGYRSS